MTLSKKIQNQGLLYRLHCLTENFGRRLDKKRKLRSRLSLFDPAFLSPRLLRKMAQWKKRLAVLKNEEDKILDEICTLERKHKLRREKKLVRFAHKAMPCAPEPSKAKKNRMFWFIFFLLLLFEKRNPRPSPFTNPRNG